MTGENFHDIDEEEVLKGVSMLQQELELERSLNQGLTTKFEELKVQHDSDNEVTTELRKRIVKLENELLEGLSKSNEKREGEEAIMSRLRKLLEKSEASRHQSEYSLLLEQKMCRELKDELADKDVKFVEETQKYKDLLKDCQKRAKEWEKAVELAEKAATLEKENMEANMSNLQSILIEKDGLIEFLTFETEEKKKQLEESAKVISNEQKESAKIKDKLATCEQVIVQQKEKNKQTLLKLAVYEQKEKKHQQETKDWSEERNKIENQLQRERGLNIQSAQQFSKVEEELLKLEKANRDLTECLEKERQFRRAAEQELETVKNESNALKEKSAELETQINSLKVSVEKTKEEMSEELKGKEDHIAHLMSEISQHQNICSDLASELQSLQKSMEQIEDQYSRSISCVEQLYCQNLSKSPSKSPFDMVTLISERFTELTKQALEQGTEIETLTRAVERSQSMSDVQKKSIESKSETIRSLHEQVKELTEQTGSQQLENTTLHTTNKALQQQVQDMTTLLATEQEKTLTLLKDKKEVIKQKHESLKEQCETVRHIGETLGDKIGDTDWTEICRATLQAAQRCVTEKGELNVMLKEAQEETKTCHVSMETLSKAVDAARVECSRKLAESETVHSEHTKVLENNYMQLIDNLNSKLKASEMNSSSTNDKIRSFYQENEQLKEHIHSLEEDLLTCEQRRVNFQAAVGMLGSTVLHHMNSYNRLLHVLSFYKLQLSNEEAQSEEIVSLSDALSEQNTAQRPVFTFRKGVIAVLAANRLRVLGKEFKQNYVLGVPAGNNPITWLESEGLDKLVTSAVRHWRSRPLANTADKLVSAIYNNTHTLCAEMYPGSLLHKIALGQRNETRSYSLPNPVLNVRTFVLNVTQRLHSVEIERRSLIAKVNHWKKEATELRGAVEQTAILSRKVQELESMAFETVPISKHEGVMKELASVMSREECLREEAHNMRSHLKRLEQDYENTLSQLNERSETLDEAIKDLSNQKVQQRQTEQTHRQQARKISSLESDKKSLFEQLQTVQKCADSRSRDHDLLMSYLSKLQVALQERKIRVTSGNLSSYTTGYLSVEGVHSEEVEEVQKICAMYEDILKLTHRRVSGLERDVQSFKSHTDSLKGELSAACQRLALEDIPVGKPLVGLDFNKNDSLIPLVQRTDSQVKELGAKVGQNFSDVIDNVMSWS